MPTTPLHTILSNLLQQHSFEAIQEALKVLVSTNATDLSKPEDKPAQPVRPMTVEPKIEPLPEITNTRSEMKAAATAQIPTVTPNENTQKSEQPEVHDPAKKRKQALRDLRHFAMWSGPNGKPSLQIAYNTFVANGGSKDYAEKTIREAEILKSKLKKIKHQIISGSLPCTSTQYPFAVQQLLDEHNLFSRYIKKDIRWAMGKRTETTSLRKSTKSLTHNIPKTKTTPIHELSHRPSWDLLIDESGDSFHDEANRVKSCIVGVLVPTDDTIEPLEIHSMDETDPNVKIGHLRKFMSLKDCSVFGLRLDTLSNVKGQQWIDSVAEVVAWVIRLIPAQEPTTITVHVEQREPHAAGTEQSRIQRLLLQNLAQVAPLRANNITLDIRFVHKYNPIAEQQAVKNGKPYPTHRLLAYADLLAHLWHSTEKVYKQWLKESGLTHHFLHMDLHPVHMRILDTSFESTTGALSGDAWNRLISDTSNNSSVIGYISQRWIEKTRTDAKQWDRCMDEFQRHLYSKAIHMRLLIKQSNWLQRVCEDDSTYTLSNRDKLVFKMSQLASRNHSGEIITEQDIHKLQTLQSNMEFEDIRLICFLDLHLAVQLTHTYNFDRAIQLMKRWEAEDLRVIGINYKGRVLSTIGQQLAFQHKYAEAIAYFDQAIAMFGRLSSEDEALKEQRQTRSYKVIAMMDAKIYSPQQIEDELILLHPTLNTMATLCEHLKTNKAAEDKYTHHIFVRYLYLYQPVKLVSQYIAGAKTFTQDTKHPWGWISLYRGLILEAKDKEIANKCFRHAVKQASAHGIEEAILIVFLETARRKGITLNNNPIASATIQQHIDNVRNNIPCATPFHENIQHILKQQSWNPSLWIHTLLPFNFH